MTRRLEFEKKKSCFVFKDNSPAFPGEEASQTVYAMTLRIPNTVHPKYELQLPFCSVSLPLLVRFFNSLLKINFSSSNSTKSPASGAGNVSEPTGLERAQRPLRF
jgi:hypothetical protein